MTRIVFWLLPDEKQTAILQAIIDGLAGRYPGPSFLPHVTLMRLADNQTDRWQQVLEEVAGRHAPVTAAINPVPNFGNIYTRACSLEVAQTAELDQVHAAVPHIKPDRSFDPHLSLWYGEPGLLPPGVLDDWLPLPFDSLHLDRLCAVGIGERVESADDVASWQLLGTMPLGANKS